MSHSTQLHLYIARLRKRMRLGAWLRGAVIFTGTALAVTIALVLVLNHFAFPARGIVWGRFSILLALAAAAALGLALPLLRLTRARAVRQAEIANPELEQRLTTFEEHAAHGDDPFLELLAADTLKHTAEIAPSKLVPDQRLFALGGAGVACLAVLAWMVAAGPGYLGYGASLLWTGPKKAPLYALTVRPGDITVRRNSDQLIVAHVRGMRPARAQLFARFQSAAAWEPVIMQSAPEADGGATYRFVFAGLPENVEYYVAAGPLVSPHYKVRVVDLPSVKQINVTYRYPKWTGMKPVTEEHSGDLRAIEGTDAQIEIQMDRPLKNGQLTLDGGPTIQLAGAAGNLYHGTIHMEKDGAYHVTASDDGQLVRLSEDYFIATDKAQPPQVAIDRPAGDYRASPIEEVTVGVKASDDFALTDANLHYSVNGGADHDVKLLDKPGAKQVDGSHLIALEDLKLVPGDVISVYATARDGHSQSQTDISFIQVDPFERDFTQSQQEGGGGGGGGGGGDQTEISKRQKELIAATWKQQNDKSATPKDAAAQGQFLSDAQQKLRDQVSALSIRMQSRDISEANQEFTDFDKDMQAAAAAMGPSADKLRAMQWKDAMPLEQKALQALLRAEATFRQIEVAFGQSGGGGSGGGNSGRDLASLFDLELDTEKNQYETSQTASPAEQRQKQIEDALEKLDALARRQEDLANQPHDPQQSFQQRWQQEMLRREAEQLQRQMEQMAQNQPQGNRQNQGNQQSPEGANGSQGESSPQQNAQQQSGQQQSSAQGQSSGQGQSNSSGGQSQQSASAQGGAQSASGFQSSQRRSGAPSASSGESSLGHSSDQRIQEALNRLKQATGMMNRNSTPQQSAEAARQAAERLREAQNLLAGSQRQMANGQMDSMVNEAGRLAQEERAQAARIDKAAKSGQQTGNSDAPNLDDMMARLHERDQLAADRQQLSNDLSKLEKNMRNAAREMASDQPDVAKKLRDALSQMDESDLDNHMQRTADWLRSGINPNSNGTESEIAQGLSQLNSQLQQAQRTMAQARPGAAKPGAGAGQADQTAALDQVERLRSELEAMERAQNGGNGRAGANAHDGNGQNAGGWNRAGQNGQRQGPQVANDGRQGRNGQNAPGQNASRQGAAGQNAYGDNAPVQSTMGRNGGGGQPQGGFQAQPLGRNGGKNGSQLAQGGGAGNQNGQRGAVRNGLSGDTRNGGGAWDGAVWGNYDTGNNTPTARGPQQAAPSDASGNPADSERSFDQELRQLRELRQMIGDDPEAAKQVQELTRQMQHLDPARFPGNPAMVERMHREILSSVDKLELQLQYDGAATDARIGKPDAIPAGYQESVADYYRRISQTH